MQMPALLQASHHQTAFEPFSSHPSVARTPSSDHCTYRPIELCYHSIASAIPHLSSPESVREDSCLLRAAVSCARRTGCTVEKDGRVVRGMAVVLDHGGSGCRSTLVAAIIGFGTVSERDLRVFGLGLVAQHGRVKAGCGHSGHLE